MCRFVYVDVDIGQSVAEEDQITAVIVSMPACGWERDDMTTKLARMDRQAAEAVNEVSQWAVATLVVAKNPNNRAL